MGYAFLFSQATAQPNVIMINPFGNHLKVYIALG
jgi:hypothetical protein